MKCEICSQTIYDAGATECPFCNSLVVQPDTPEFKYREALRHRIRLEGAIAELRQTNSSIRRQIVQQRNGYVLTVLLLAFLSLSLFLRKKRDTVPFAELKKYSDSLDYYKTRAFTQQNQKAHSLKYVVGDKENNHSLGSILFSDPKVGYKILKDNGIDTARWKLNRLRKGDTIIFNFK